MINLRKANERGHANHGWLNSYHTFSFANYYDPAHMEFRALRVINEDRVQAEQGFGNHSHQDMEIISYLIEGALEHHDNMENHSIIVPGEVQRMTAGTGVTHSEYNHSKKEVVHFLQIWIQPDTSGLNPGYEQKQFQEAYQSGQLTLVGSKNGKGGSLTIHQDVNLYVGHLEQGQELEYQPPPNRYSWIQMVHGSLAINNLTLEVSDGMAVSEEPILKLTGNQKSEFLLFDLA